MERLRNAKISSSFLLLLFCTSFFFGIVILILPHPPSLFNKVFTFSSPPTRPPFLL